MNVEPMKLVDKAAIVVKPKQPYVDWANSFDDEGPTLSLGDARENADVFLVKHQKARERTSTEKLRITAGVRTGPPLERSSV